MMGLIVIIEYMSGFCFCQGDVCAPRIIPYKRVY